MRIQSNISAINTQRQMFKVNNAQAKALEKLSSGFRINRAADDAAGLAISEKMRSQIRGMKQASRNAQDGISVVQTAEGALDEIHSMLQRMKELAVQSANDSNQNVVDREAIQMEVNALSSEIDSITDKTQFNKMTLLDGSFKGKAFHVGANQNETIGISIESMTAEGIGLEPVKTGDVVNTIVDEEAKAATRSAQSFKYDPTLFDNTGGSEVKTIEYELTTNINGQSKTEKKSFSIDPGKSLNIDEFIGQIGGLFDEVTFVKSTEKGQEGNIIMTGVTAGENTFSLKGPGLGDGGVTLVEEKTITFANGDDNLIVKGKDATITAAGSELEVTILKGSALASGTTEKVTIGETITIKDAGALKLEEGAEVMVKAVNGSKVKVSANAVITGGNVTLKTGDKFKGSAVIDLGEADKTLKFDKDVTAILADGTVKKLGAGVDYNVKALPGELNLGTGQIQIIAKPGEEVTVTTNSTDMKLMSRSAVIADDGNKASAATFKDVVTKNMLVRGANVLSKDNANASMAYIQGAIETVAFRRAELGAIQNRIEHTIANLDNSHENLTAAEARVRDTDMAAEIIESARTSILSQSAIAMLSQANQVPQNVLSLLR